MCKASKRRVFAVLSVIAVSFLLFRSAEAESNPTAMVYGLIRSQMGHPLRGTVVRLRGTRFRAVSDEKGTYELRGVPPGSYVLIAEGPGHQAKERRLRVEGHDVLQVNLVVEPAMVAAVAPRGAGHVAAL